MHRNDLTDNYSDASWDADSKNTANSLLHGVTNFDFVIVFLIIYQYLSHLAGITVKLQSSTLDILEAYKQIEDVKRFYKQIRKEIQADFHKVYQQAERMAAAVNIEPSKPRTCVCQRNRPNAEAETVEGWYKVNVTIPFLDHVIAELDSQFSAVAQRSSQLLGLVPSIMCSK